MYVHLIPVSAPEICPDETQNPTPEPKDIWGIPRKGKYNEVREYVVDRKKGDPQFREFCLTHSFREMCSFLSDEFGWDVDEHSLGANINRH